MSLIFVCTMFLDFVKNAEKYLREQTLKKAVGKLARNGQLSSKFGQAQVSSHGVCILRIFWQSVRLFKDDKVELFF